MSRKTNTLCLALIATWSLALASRYYAADYVNGNDGNLGYSDSSMFAAGAVAVKTLTRLRQIIPDLGDGRAVVIAINGNADGVTDLQYLKPDGVTLDDLDLRGIYGYRFVLIRSTNGFSNSATDKKVCATAVGQAGPGAGGVWTCAGGGTTTVFSVSSGTLTTTLGALNGMRVRFTGNVTAALANQAFMLQTNTASQITLSRALTVAPAVGDTFVIERPGVSVNQIYINSAIGPGSPLTSSSVGSFNLVGIRARQTGTVQQQFWASVSASFSCTFVELDAYLSTRATEQLNFRRQYFDETATVITPGCGVRWAQSASVTLMINEVASLANIQDSALTILGANTLISRAYALTLGSGCFVNTNGFSLNFVSCGSSRTNGSGVGALNSTATARMIVFGRLISTSSLIAFNGIDLNSAGANPCITILDSLGGQAALIANLFSSAGGNTDVVVDCTGLNASNITLTGTLTAAMTTLGDVRTAGPVIVPFTGFVDNYIDAQANVYKPITAVAITRRTPGIFYNVPILGADPGTLLDGDVWITDIAGVRNICARIGGVTYRSLMV